MTTIFIPDRTGFVTIGFIDEFFARKTLVGQKIDKAGTDSLAGDIVPTTTSSVDLGSETKTFEDIFTETLDLNPASAPSPTTDKLYNVGGDLFFDGVDLSTNAGLWEQDGADIFRLSNVGIGTNNPANNLHIYDTNVGTSALALFQNTGAGEDAFITFEDASKEFSIGLDGADGDKFKISQGTDLGTNDYIIVQENGNVGIGETSPSVRLDVNGNIKLTGDLVVDTSVFVVDVSAGAGIGYVGIGTATPTANLDIISTNAGALLFLRADTTNSGDHNAEIILQKDGGANRLEMGVARTATGINYSNQLANAGYIRLGFTTQAFQIATSGSAKFTILNSGNVGIGTNAPLNILHVRDTNAGTTPLLQLQNTGTNEDSSLRFSNDSQTITMGIDGSDSDKFKISDNTTLGTNDRLTITTSGNVGIGTNNPETPLHVEETFSASATLLRLTSGTRNLDIRQPAINDSDSPFEFFTNNSFKWIVDSAVMSMDTGGNIGIGTAVPQSKLHVVGAEFSITNGHGQDEGIFLLPHNTINGNAGGRLYFKENDGGTAGCSVGYNGLNDGDLLNWAGNSFNVQMHAGSATGETALTIERATLNVGVGISKPLEHLHIATTSTDDQIVRVENDLGGNSDVTQGIHFIKTTAGDEFGFKIESDGFNNADSLLNFISRESSVDTLRMVIERNTGFVGIGTESPASLLHISSGTDGNCVVTIEADTDNNDENDNPSIRFIQDGGATNASIGIEGDSGTTFTDTLLNALYLVSENANTLQLGTNGAIRMTIESGGDIGIGTINPSHDLHVIGTAGLSTGTSWTNTSDISIKKNIKITNTDDCLKSINSLIIKSFKYKKAYADKNKIKYNNTSRLGLIAQDVITSHANPHIVTGIKNNKSVDAFNEDYDLLQLNISELIFESFGAIQSLSRQVVDLQHQLSGLQNQTN